MKFFGGRTNEKVIFYTSGYRNYLDGLRGPWWACQNRTDQILRRLRPGGKNRIAPIVNGDVTASVSRVRKSGVRADIQRAVL
jgi:hypothetical protein